MRRILVLLFPLILLTTVSGQIIYTDIEDEIMDMPSVPAGVGSNYNYYDFQINNDLITDFTFVLYVSKFYSWEDPLYQVHEVQDISLHGSFRFVQFPDQGCVKIIEENDTINSVQNWSLTNCSLAIFAQTYFSQSDPKSYYCNDPDLYRYFGFSFVLNENTHYGWIRLSWNTSSVTVHDFAYNNAPNEEILAGQTESVGYTSPLDIDPIEISIRDNILRLKSNKQLIGNVNIRFYNMSGSCIKSAEINSNHDFVRLDEFSTGLYLLQIAHNNNYTIQKVYIK